MDVQVIFHMMEQRNLKAAYKFYCGKSLDDAHEALPDAMATSLEVLKRCSIGIRMLKWMMVKVT
jgi:DNA polymerase-3 subunit epsilon